MFSCKSVFRRSLLCICPASAIKTPLKDLFFIILLIIAKSVSNIGIASITIGAINTTSVYVFATPTIEITAIINPINCAPTSPTNVFAGYLLNGKNPAVPPSKCSY